MGSVLAVDASGSHWLQYGSARQHVISLQVVLADGQVIQAGQHDVDDPAAESAHPARQKLVRRLAELIRREEPLITQHQPRAVLDRCGYHLHDVLHDGRLDLASLLVGSEGTLGLITEARVRTTRIPRYRGLILLFFDRLDSAARAAQEIVRRGVATCDLMDRRLLTIARELDVRYELLIPPEAEALLLIEHGADDASEVGDHLRKIVVDMTRHQRLAFDARLTIEKDERDFYWRLSRRVVSTLYRLKGNTRALPFIEDIAVPPDTVPEFLVKAQNVLKAHAVTASMFGHVGHGQLHFRPFLDLANPQHLRIMQELATDLYDEVLRVGGTISSQHSTGLSRTWFVRRQYGPLYDVFREVKRIFDPQNIFNPGKMVADAPQPLIKNLRPAAIVSPEKEPASSSSEPIAPVPLVEDLRLVWEDGQLDRETQACNGCARCRTLGPEERMCPIFRFAPREEASPRAKANLMRAVLSGRLAPDSLSREDLKTVMDLCVNCHQCRFECPAQVDIPKLVQEAKAQYVAANGMRFSDWCLARMDLFGAWGSALAPLANWGLRNRRVRWLIEKTMGIAQGRKLPRFESRPFLQWAHRRRLTRPPRRGGQKILYFVDIYANWHDAQLARALVAILEHNGAAVYVAPGQVQSGAAAIALGAAERARRFAQRNVRLLADAVRQGYHVICTEPTAALCLQHEYLNLLDEDDARLVAEHTSEACSYLWHMHQSGKLELNLKPVNVTLGYHLPCHLKALRVGSPGENLLGLIPGLVVQRIDRGCSGMAGTFGLRRDNYRSSLRAGWGVISALREPGIQAGVTECSACKIQMEQGTSKPTFHPLKILALSYDLMPELATLLATRGEELVVT
jgi:Fe-S oxidoreductase/FAD/FMN-containing dehydrogenase